LRGVSERASAVGVGIARTIAGVELTVTGMRPSSTPSLMGDMATALTRGIERRARVEEEEETAPLSVVVLVALAAATTGSARRWRAPPIGSSNGRATPLGAAAAARARSDEGPRIGAEASSFGRERVRGCVWCERETPRARVYA